MRVAHFALKLSLRHQRRHRVDDQHVNRARTHQRIGNFQRLFTRIRLRYQKIIDIHADFFGIRRIQRMLRVDKRARTALFLRLRDNAQRQRRLTGAFRPVNLDDSPFRQPADAERDVYAERTGRNRLNINLGVLSQPHDGAFAESSLNLAQRRV